MTPPQGQFQHFQTGRNGFGYHSLGGHGFGEYVKLPGWVRTIPESHGFGDHGFGDHGFGDHGYADPVYGDHG
eukprot:g4506.t1